MQSRPVVQSQPQAQHGVPYTPRPGLARPDNPLQPHSSAIHASQAQAPRPRMDPMRPAYSAPVVPRPPFQQAQTQTQAQAQATAQTQPGPAAPGFVPGPRPIHPQQPMQPQPQPMQQQQPRPPLEQTNSVDSLAQTMSTASIQHRAAPPPGRSRRVYATSPAVQGITSPHQPPQPRPMQQYQQQQPHPQPQPQQLPQQLPPHQVHQQAQQQGPSPMTAPSHPSMLAPPVKPAKAKIDPNQIPSPVAVQAEDEAIHLAPDAFYGTCSETVPMPRPTTDVRTLDQGNSNPRFLRSTLRELPESYDLVKDTYLPFGILTQPLAPLHPLDAPVPVAKTGEEGPVRCTRCKGYINPWCQFTDGGRKFKCNLCEFINDVPMDYFCHLDMTGRRMDLEQRPELQYGSVEFDVPEIYWTRKPSPLRMILAIDVSRSAVQSGILAAVCADLNTILFEELAPGTRVAIMTFDTSLHFYNLSPEFERPQMLVVPDVNDAFLPLAEDALYVDPQSSKKVIQELLTNLPRMFGDNPSPTAAFGSAVKGALLSLKATGGKVHVFQSVLPTAGPGALKHREDPKLYNTDKEKQLFAPQDSLYAAMGKECVQEGVCVDVWLFPPANDYVDASTLGLLSALTGGETYYYPGFQPSKHGPALCHALKKSFTCEQGYNAALRLRCSNGVSVDDQFGNFYMNNSTDVELAGVHADTTVAFKLKHDSKLENEGFAQCALLYTTSTGQRRVRIHNIRMPVTSNTNTLFRQADVDSAMNLIVKQTISQMAKRSGDEQLAEVDRICVHILSAYRKFCAANAAAGQLILPESFKVLPVYTLGLRKSAALRKDATLNSDVRVCTMRKFKAAPTARVIRWLYPRMIRVHEMGKEGQVGLPMERLSYFRFQSHGVYLIEGIDTTYIWIGANVAAELLQALFGVSELSKVDVRMSVLPSLATQLSQQLHQATELDQRALCILRQGLDSEHELVRVLLEDETLNDLSYVDYLCQVHKLIQDEMAREKHESFVANASYWAYRY